MYASGSGVPTLIVPKLPAVMLWRTAAGLDWEAMEIEAYKPLAPLTTLGIGGPARWFAEARSEEDVAEAAEWARGRGVRLFVLGGGSNLLVADKGFDGLVLRVGLKGIRVREGVAGSDERVYEVAAGEAWDALVQRTVDESSAGVECLAGIPGTVGGTPVQNVGAYGQEVSSTIERVRVLDLEERAFVELSNAECGFAYRRSVMNSSRRGRYVVTRVDYRLKRGGEPGVRYAELARVLAERGGQGAPTLAEVAATVRALRDAKGMLLRAGDADCRSAGSFFKNPVVSEEQYSRIAAAARMAAAGRIASAGGEEPPRFAAGDGTERVKIPAAWLVERAGFQKGYALGAAGVSSRHTLALVNRGGATAEDVLRLAETICGAVAERFGVRLEMEPVRLGF
jgi:UDP-N-acetylmuramate dehydrogenase